MILSYLLRKLLPWIIEIGLWLTVIAGATLGYGENYLGSPVLSAALGALFGFLPALSLWACCRRPFATIFCWNPW